MVVKYLTDGGIPDGWTVQNLSWLAQAHWRYAIGPRACRDPQRAAWHKRWAILIEDLLESRCVNNH